MIKLIQGDCLEVMATLEKESIDAVITDPPYGAKRPSAWRLAENRFSKIANNDAVYTQWISLAANSMKHGAAFYMFACWQTMELWRQAITKAGIVVRSCIVWDKQIHGLADVRTCYAPQYELILYGSKGRLEFPGRRPVDVISVKRVGATKLLHSYEKPVELLGKLLADTVPVSGIVLDPFMGSGSTGVACAQSNRFFIGIELDIDYFSIASSRIQSAIDEANQPHQKEFSL